MFEGCMTKYFIFIILLWLYYQQDPCDVLQVAEKRKALLDELAIKYQKEHDMHREQSIAAEEKHRAQTVALETEIDQMKVWGEGGMGRGEF